MKKDKMIVDKRLDIWLDKQKDDYFPECSSGSYKTRYKEVAGYLNKNVHTEVEKRALFESIKKCIKNETVDPEAVDYLNNHGPGHVAKVIDRASDLLQASKCSLSPYEGYLLLMSIQFHDSGNIFGREGHESSANIIMKDLGSMAGEDQPEKTTILKIAAAHSGNFNGSKDKISMLAPGHDVLNQKVRTHFLAAILRFADELADDRTRAARFSLKNKLIPKNSEIYHVYSFALQSLIINESSVRLSFIIDKERAIKKFVINGRETYLLDEIYRRTVKMHLERLFCMRFCRPYNINIEKIEVGIEVYDDSESLEPIQRISYALVETGYPNAPVNGIYGLTNGLSIGVSQYMDGEWLKNQLVSS